MRELTNESVDAMARNHADYVAGPLDEKNQDGWCVCFNNFEAGMKAARLFYESGSSHADEKAAGDGYDEALKIAQDNFKNLNELIRDESLTEFYTNLAAEMMVQFRQSDANGPENNTGWISVKERLPGKEGEVLIRCHDYESEYSIFHEVGNWDGTEFNAALAHFGDALASKFTITHWMPLPEAPQDKSLQENPTPKEDHWLKFREEWCETRDGELVVPTTNAKELFDWFKPSPKPLEDGGSPAQ